MAFEAPRGVNLVMGLERLPVPVPSEIPAASVVVEAEAVFWAERVKAAAAMER